jgi:hypothetical protein
MAGTLKKRGSGWIAAPLVVFVLVAAAWTGVWFYVRGEVDRSVTQWLAAEAAAGRTHECNERAIGGWPFRIELTCTRAAFRFATPQGPVDARIAGFTAVAQVYAPQHIIADLRGPVALQQGADDLGLLEFTRGQASYTMRAGAFDRFSLVLDRPSLARAAGARPDVVAEQMQVHARNAASGGRDYDVALSARAAGAPGIRPEQGADLDLTGVVRGWPDPAAQQGGGLVATWARGGGTVDLQRLRVKRGNGLLAVDGRMGFNPTGRAQGQFDAVLADPQALLGGIAIPGVGDPAALVGPALVFVGRPAEIDGRRGTRVTLRVDDGVLGVGAVQLLQFPPVF